MINNHGVDPLVARAYTESLRKHLSYVLDAGQRLGVPQQQLLDHDQSKWESAEFAAYAHHFYGDDDPQDFARAMLHHFHHNPHHWEHWIFPNGFTPKGSENGVIEMPRPYALEMVADWLGASMAFTGSWDMTEWLTKHLPLIVVHSRTAAYLADVLVSIGYEDVVKGAMFAKLRV